MRLIRTEAEEIDGSRFHVYLLCDNAGQVLRCPHRMDFAAIVSGPPFGQARKQLGAGDTSGILVRLDEEGELYHVALLTRYHRNEAPAEIEIRVEVEGRRGSGRE